MKNQPLLNSNSDYIELDDIILIKESNNEATQTINNKDINKLLNISSNYIFKKIFLYIKYNTSLKIIKNNKSLQTKLEINIDNYKDYSDFGYITKKEKIEIKKESFNDTDSGLPFAILFSWCIPSSIYLFYLLLYLL